MSKELIINAGRTETRIAILEEENIAEVYIERGNQANIIGNIYKGRVQRVLPGIQAAFIDIGLGRTAFLYVTDVREDEEIYKMLMAVAGEQKNSWKNSPASNARIEDLLTDGQEIIVQVTKEPIGSKGAKVSSHISLPGRYLVYLPGSDHVGISRRIEDTAERERLKNIVLSAKPEEGGFIIRTASEGADEKEIIADIEYLVKMWRNIDEKGKKSTCRTLLHHDLDITLRAVRDLLSPEIDNIVIDSESEYTKIARFMKEMMPGCAKKIRLYRDKTPIFEHYGIEMEIDDLLNEKVWLKSRGFIVIQSTEALTAIDVNTGSYTGKKSFEETVLKTNLEAAREIACQLRLRNIGGIIIIDFIDMEKPESRDKVTRTLEEALKKDRAITRLLEISSLGLLEMTRKRIRSSISDVLCSPCEKCDGRGINKSPESIALEVLRAMEKELVSSISDKVDVSVHPEISDILLGEFAEDIRATEEKFGTKVNIKTDASHRMDGFTVNV